MNNAEAMPLTDDERLVLDAQPPMSLDAFCERLGKVPETVHRWVAAGMLKLENINGKNYLTAAEIAMFNRRVRAGEFARENIHIRELRSRRNQPRHGRKAAA